MHVIYLFSAVKQLILLLNTGTAYGASVSTALHKEALYSGSYHNICLAHGLGFKRQVTCHFVSERLVYKWQKLLVLVPNRKCKSYCRPEDEIPLFFKMSKRSQMVSVQSWNKYLCDRNCAIDLQSHVESVRERTYKEHYYIIFTKLDNKSKDTVPTAEEVCLYMPYDQASCSNNFS